MPACAHNLHLGERQAGSEGRLEHVDVNVGPLLRFLAGTARRRPRRGRMPKPAMLEDPLDHFLLRRLDEGHHLHLPAALGARQRINLVDPLDEHGPSLAGVTPAPGMNIALRAISFEPRMELRWNT